MKGWRNYRCFLLFPLETQPCRLYNLWSTSIRPTYAHQYCYLLSHISIILVGRWQTDFAVENRKRFFDEFGLSVEEQEELKEAQDSGYVLTIERTFRKKKFFLLMLRLLQSGQAPRRFRAHFCWKCGRLLPHRHKSATFRLLVIIQLRFFFLPHLVVSFFFSNWTLFAPPFLVYVCVRVKLTRKTLKLYSDFYSADILIASPLGLRLIIGVEDDKQRDFDFLSSIEVLVIDQVDVLAMQNWDHLQVCTHPRSKVAKRNRKKRKKKKGKKKGKKKRKTLNFLVCWQHVMDHLNLKPQQSHGCDFSRLRSWTLNELGKYARQTIILSDFSFPEANALFSRKWWATMTKRLIRYFFL